jgi:hypothetical protein
MSENPLNAAVFERLSAPGDTAAAADALSSWTREKMWTWWHIPFRYYIPEGRPQLPHLEQLYCELAMKGKIVLDRRGEPCCLSGRQPALLHSYPDLHGPWKEEPCDSSNATN